jgi:hypothetical protein
MKEDWIKDIHSRMKDHQEKAPEGLLDEIKQELSRRGETPFPSKGNMETAKVWTLRAMAAAAMLAFGFFLLQKSDNTDSLSHQAAHNMTACKQPMNPHQQAVLEPTVVPGISKARYPHPVTLHTSNKLLASAEGSSNKLNDVATSSAVDELSIASVQSERTKQADVNKGTATSEKSATNNGQSVEKKSSVSKKTDVGIYHQSADYQTAYHSYRHHASAESLLDVGVYFGGMGIASNNSNGILLAAADPVGNYTDNMSGSNIPGGMMESSDVEIHKNHHQPVKFGISVRYNIDNHWGILTGLSYSYLSSDFTSVTHGSYNTWTQNLHYIGIPVAVSYSLMRGKHYQVYSIAGMEMEKLVKSTGDVTVKESRPQFSANASVGAEYKFTDIVSAYFEPGVNYYIDNGSAVENIYKEKPFNFNLNLGFRININK